MRSSIQRTACSKYWSMFAIVLTLYLSVHGFSPEPPASLRNVITSGRSCASFTKNENAHLLFLGDDEDEDEEALALQDDDWRAFRAKLVMGEKTETSTDSPSQSTLDGDLDGIGSLFQEDFEVDAQTTTQIGDGPKLEQTDDTSTLTPLDPSQWAYESGDVIEQGAVILGGVEQEFGFGLRQQYFHKVAILVLDHSATFTKGIILNRPTDLMLDDDVNEGKKWRVWFGGDVEGVHARHPDIVCLHALKNERATKASIPVMKDIQWTTFHNAKKLVKAGAADVSDFWVFVGYAGWGPSQLAGELERDSWYMVATDSQTLLKELARQGEGADPRDAGLDTWNLLMNMIGRKKTADEHSGGFDDLMLKEWALTNLLSDAAGGSAGRQYRDPQAFNTNPDLVDKLVGNLKSKSNVGVLLRASSTDRSPFLLNNQELHKSIVLILSDDEAASVGVVLNRPSKTGLDIKVEDKKTGGSSVVTIPMRFGGQYAVRGEETLLWLHCSEDLRKNSVGSPIGDQDSGVWKCTAQDVINAVGQGRASPEDFLVVSGVSVWEKNIARGVNGIEGEVDLSRFEIIPDSKRDTVWNGLLSQQEVLSRINFSQTLDMAEKAWQAGGTAEAKSSPIDLLPPITGLGENFDEDDETMVFKTETKVADLADLALRTWCATFLLGTPEAASQ